MIFSLRDVNFILTNLMVLFFLLFYLCGIEITGPIMLDTYRVIADYSKSSKYELTLKAGDLVDIVEKSSNGETGMEFSYCIGPV